MKFNFNPTLHPIMSAAPEQVVEALESAGTVETILELLITLTREQARNNYTRLSSLSDYLNGLVDIVKEIDHLPTPTVEQAMQAVELTTKGVEIVAHRVGEYIDNAYDLSDEFTKSLLASTDPSSPSRKDMN